MGATGGKSLSLEQNENLRRALKRLVDEEFEGIATRAAKALGVSQPLISGILDGSKGAGPKVIQAIADYTGRSIDDLYGRPALPLPTGGYQVLGQHPDYPVALAEALARPSRLLRPSQIEAVGGVALSKPPAHLTRDFILRMAEALAEAEPFDDPET
jgi:transcriptional regulator with XRE-family HTH domain